MSEKLQKRLERTQEALRESEATMHAVVDASAEGIIKLDVQGRLLSCNAAARRMFGYTSEEMIGITVVALVPSSRDSRKGLRFLAPEIERLLAVGGEIEGRRKDGTLFPLDLSVSETQHDGGKGFVAVLRDLTRQRQLERHVADAALAERRSVAQDLHDSLGGQISGIGILAEVLRKALEEESSAHIELATELAAHVRGAHEQLRQISRGLHPVDIDRYGLMAALKSLAERIDSLHTTSCTFVCPQPVSLEDNSAATQMFRVVEEAVQNALRHARAGNIVLGLEASDGAVTLWVRDDGIGIDDTAVASDGMGLLTMRYRADLIGARLTVGPAPKRGTLVACALPLPGGARDETA